MKRQRRQGYYRTPSRFVGYCSHAEFERLKKVAERMKKAMHENRTNHKPDELPLWPEFDPAALGQE